MPSVVEFYHLPKESFSHLCSILLRRRSLEFPLFGMSHQVGKKMMYKVGKILSGLLLGLANDSRSNKLK